jgi:hypothetical protein
MTRFVWSLAASTQAEDVRALRFLLDWYFALEDDVLPIVRAEKPVAAFAGAGTVDGTRVMVLADFRLKGPLVGVFAGSQRRESGDHVGSLPSTLRATGNDGRGDGTGAGSSMMPVVRAIEARSDGLTSTKKKPPRADCAS